MISRSVAKFILPAVLAAGAMSAQAMEFNKADDAVDLRKAQMGLVATYFGDMGAMVKGKAKFNAEQYKTDAERLAVLAQWSATGFESSTYMNSDSKAKPAIWEDKADFDKKMAEFAEAAAKLQVAAAGGDLKASIPAFKAVADTCGSCHKPYKFK
ncbi:c-type cytochrome [Parendozoicomonas haliclonae]|uniref:Cytochrome c n=1 Tax=Parendozoicomonas haliclonae TaxID=1960125 RepID=A0A1X7AE95_9GAMM|nr:cytochrome c [Parendozoicomonas haliclonae]SMA32341.1 Cytochrome c' [Parendozoicomonas haliclonae]